MESVTQLIVLISSALSGAILTYTLSRAGKESKIRPAFEWARAALGLTTLLVMGWLIGTHTEPVLAVAAVAVGGVLGISQGRQTVVTVKPDGLWATRTLWGIIFWSIGLIAMQLAGLSTRTGTFKFGQAITMFSVAVTVGMIFGRSTPERLARSRAAGMSAAALLLFPVLAVSLVAAQSDQAEAQDIPLLTGEAPDHTDLERPGRSRSLHDRAGGFHRLLREPTGR